MAPGFLINVNIKPLISYITVKSSKKITFFYLNNGVYINI